MLKCLYAGDTYHDQVRQALVNDGWTITHDPLSLPWGGTTLQVDLGAERLIAAEKAARRIAVEVKSFISASRIADLKDALGPFVLYRHVIHLTEPDRTLYLAVRQDVFQTLFDQPYGELLCAAERINLLVFDEESEVIIKWIP